MVADHRRIEGIGPAEQQQQKQLSQVTEAVSSREAARKG